MAELLLSRPLIRRLFLIACLTATAMQGYVVAYGRSFHFRDFDVHREVGRRFLTGEYLYSSGLCYPYMPSAAMYFAPLALLDRAPGLALRYAVAVCALMMTLVLLNRMVRSAYGAAAMDSFLTGSVAILLTLQFILQDLDDGGPHLILLAILVGGIYSVWQGHEKLGAMWFGLAIALKVTPALFLPFFAWKRQWRLAGATALMAVAWIVLPVVWMGPTSWWSHQKEWIEVGVGSSVGMETPVTRGNEQRVRNQSLPQALMRYFVTYDEDHPLRREDPGYVPLLNLSPPVAKPLVVGVMAGLVVLFGRITRQPYQGRGDPEWLRECSGVIILALLFCPVTWVQHLVWLVPAVYLLVSQVHAGERLDRLTLAWLGILALLTVILNYEFLGRENFARVLSFHPFTIAMLLTLGLLMRRPAPRQMSAASSGSQSPAYVRPAGGG